MERNESDFWKDASFPSHRSSIFYPFFPPPVPASLYSYIGPCILYFTAFLSVRERVQNFSFPSGGGGVKTMLLKQRGKTAAGALTRHHLPGVSCIRPPSVICRHASTSCYCVNPPQPKQVSLAFNSFLWFVTMKQKIIKLKDTIFNRCS